MPGTGEVEGDQAPAAHVEQDGKESTGEWGTEWPGLDCPAYHSDSENKNNSCHYLCKDDSPHLMRPLDLGYKNKDSMWKWLKN